MFSRTRIRSTPSKRVARPGIDFTGRTQANSSSDWRSTTFALLKPPAIGVAMGPFRATPALRIAFSTRVRDRGAVLGDHVAPRLDPLPVDPDAGGRDHPHGRLGDLRADAVAGDQDHAVGLGRHRRGHLLWFRPFGIPLALDFESRDSESRPCPSSSFAASSA